MNAVAVEGLTKRFAGSVALDRVSFTVAPGELFGFIGPDGAGKTTLFRILVTLLEPDAGRASVLGRDVVKEFRALRAARRLHARALLALSRSERGGEPPRSSRPCSARRSMRERARIAPIYSQLEPFKTRRAAALSGGMKQKLALCCALVHRPEILLLDEPTTGVDAVSRREFWELLGAAQAGRASTIVVSTPYMDEADRCDRVALIQRGQLLAVDTPAAIAAPSTARCSRVRARDRYRGAARAARLPARAQRLSVRRGPPLHRRSGRTRAPSRSRASVRGLPRARRASRDAEVRADRSRRSRTASWRAWRAGGTDGGAA